MICDVSELILFRTKNKTHNIAKECRLHTKKASLHLNWCAAVDIENAFEFLELLAQLLSQEKRSGKQARAYSRILYNIGNQGFIPEIIYYKKKLSKKRKGKNHFPLLQYIENLH